VGVYGLRVVGVVGVPIATPPIFEERRSIGLWFWCLPFGIGIAPALFFIRRAGRLSDSVVSSASESSSVSSLSVRDPLKPSWVAGADIGIARDDDPAEGIGAREAD